MPAVLSDIIGPNLSVLFCGINPGVQAASTGHHFLGRGNRFWKTLQLAGFTPYLFEAEDDQRLLEYGCGLTAVVARATARADQVTKHEVMGAAAELQHKLERYKPRRVAFLGKAAYLALSQKRTAEWGLQDQTLAGSAVWLLPNPSGRNLGFSLDELVIAYRQLRQAMMPA